MINELMLRLMNPLTDGMLKNMLTAPYPNNPMVMTTTFEKRRHPLHGKGIGSHR